MCSLLIFPDEVHVHILSNSNLKEIINSSLTCRRLHRIVTNSLALQYRIAQLAAQVTDTEKSDLPTIERINLLHRFERNWTALDFVSNHKIVKRNSDVWELVHGVLVLGFGKTRKTVCGLDFTEVPSSILGTPGRTWRHDDLGINIRDFTIDPCQDLVAIIGRPTIGTSQSARAKYPIYLLTMSTGLPHPEATSQIPTNLALRHDHYSFILELKDDILVVLCSNRRAPCLGQDHLYIWNWKYGQLLLHRTTPEKTVRFDSFSILSPEHLLVSSFDPVRGSKYTPRLDIYKIPLRQDKQAIEVIPAYTFQLPLVNEGARIVSMLIRSDPSGANSNRVFTVNPSSCVIVVEIGIRAINEPCRLMLFVHASTFLSIALSSTQKSIVPWEKWGPSHCRLIETTDESTWIGYTYGMRYVKLLPVSPWIGRGIRPSRIQIRDFNPTPLPSLDDSSGTSTVRWVTEASLIPKARGIFLDHVRTCLRYREITGFRIYRYDGIVIDEDVLIGFYPRKESGKMKQGIEVLCV